MTTLRTLFVVVALTLSAVIASAQDVFYVRNGGSDANDGSAADALHAMATIQHAIDEAAAGDVIDVGSGNFAGANINKDITIRGAGYGAAIPTWGADVTNITSKFTLDNPAGGGREVVFDALKFGANIVPADGASTNAIVTFTNCYMAAASPVNTGGLGWAELVIAECLFDGDAQRDNAILANGLTTFNVRESYFKKYNKSAVSVSGAQKNITIEYSEFDNNNASGGSSDGALYVDVASLTGSVTVKNNLFTNNSNGLVSAGAMSGKTVSVQYNNFKSTNAGFFALKNSGTGALPASCNAYGANTAPGSVPVLLSGSVEAGPYNQVGDDNNGALVGFEPVVAQRCAVDGPIKTTSVAGKSYFRIQDAVDASAAGATVKVLKGTYTGNVTIDKNITVKGSYTETWADQDCDGRSAVVKGTSSGDYSNVVGVITVKSTANTVELANLHVTSSTATNLISNNAAASLTVNGCWLEVDPTSPLSTVPVNGALHHVRAGELYVSGSMVTRPVGGAKYINAVTFASGNGTRKVVLDACRFEGSIVATGMSVYSDVTLKNSTVVDGATDGFSVTGNTIRTLSVTSNTITNAQQHGIGFRNKATVGSDAATISNNYITGSGASNGSSSYAAIFVGGQTYGAGTHTYSNNHLSTQTGSAKGIVNERADLTPSATCNWWGSTSDDAFVSLASGNLTKSPFRIAGGGYNPSNTGFEPSGACTGYEFAVTLVPTNILCKDANTGAVGLTTSSSYGGSIASYSYSWSGPNSFTSGSKDISSLYVGSYTVTVTTNGGATKVRGVNVTEPATNVTCTSSITSRALYNGSDMSCTGANNAEITITAEGGTTTAQKPYQYSIDGGENYSSSNVFRNLAAGTYEVKVLDGNLCGSTTHFRVVNAPAPVTVSSTDKKRFYGDLMHFVSHTGAYDNGRAYHAGESVTYTAPSSTEKTYVAIVGTISGGHPPVQFPYWVEISEPSEISCVNATDGSVRVNATGGTGTLEYSKNGVDFQPSSTFTGLASGTHTFTVRDANNCQTTTTVVLNAPQPISNSSSVTSDYNGSQLSCATAADGKITVTASGGTGYLVYSKDGTNFGGSNVFENLAAGTYTLTAKDVNGCSKTSTAVITAPSSVTQSASVTSNYHGSQISCSGLSDGEITVTSSGGTGSLKYSNDNGATWQTSNKFAGLPAGTYQMRTKDANGCTTSASAVTLNNPVGMVQHALQVTKYSGSELSCYNSADGRVLIYATGGTGWYEYSKDGGSNWQTNDTFTGLAAGTYNFVIRDANDCRTETIQHIITAPTRPSFTFEKTLYSGAELNCYNSSNGQVTVTASGGSVVGSSYQYSVDNGGFGTSAVFSGLSAGTHTLRVKDGNGCEAVSQVVTFTAPAQLVASTTKKSYNGADMSTATSNDGEITASYEGGTGSVTYSWETSTNGTDGWAAYTGATNKITGLSAGYYRVTISDANSCSSTSSALQIVSPSVPTFTTQKKSYSGADLSCNNSTNGEVAVTASNGTVTAQAPYTYSIDNGGFTTNNVFTGLAAGTHLVRVKDGNGSEAQSQTITFVAPDELVASIEKTKYNGADMHCSTSNDGVITASKLGGTGAVSYAWELSANGTTGWNSYGGNTASISGLSAGYYRVTITDANGCTNRTNSLPIVAPSVPTFTTEKTLYSGQDLSCYNSTNGVVTVTASNGTATVSAPYTYSIDNGSFGTSNSFSGLAAGTHLVRVKDGNGCEAASAVVTFVAPQQLVASITKTSYNGADMTCSTSNDGEITASKTGGTGAVSYAWEKSANGTTGWSSYGGNTSSISSLAAGYYRVTITDANNCTSTSSSLRIVAPSGPTFTTRKTTYNGAELSCYNSSNGALTVTASSGTTSPQAPYTYSIDNGNFVTSNKFTGLSAGTHLVRVKDGNGCEATSAVVTFVPPAQLVATSTKTSYNGSDMNCSTSNDGKVTASYEGGTGGMTYAWQKSANGTDGWSAYGSVESPGVYQAENATVDGLSFGSNGDRDFTGTGYIENAWPNGSSVTFNVSAPYTGAYALGFRYALAMWDAPASRRVKIDGDVYAANLGFPVTTTWADFQTKWVTIDNLTAGTHTIKVEFDAASGSTSYVNLDRIDLASKTSIVDNLSNGYYRVTTTDANLCSSTSSSVQITAPSAVSISGVEKKRYSMGLAGFISYQGAYDNNRVYYDGQSMDFTDGKTYVMVATNRGTGWNPNNAPGIWREISIPSEISCSGATDGGLRVTASGGTGTLKYSVDGTNFQTSSVFAGLAAGTYTVTAKDANNCSTTSTVTITAPAALSSSAAVTSAYNGSQINCNTSSDGQITVTTTGGTGILLYSINGSGYDGARVFSNKPAGTYTITTKDDNGCTTTATVTITAPAALTASAAVTSNYNGAHLHCATSSDGEITITSTGGTGTLNYSIDGTNFQTSNKFTGLGAGAYSFTTKDANGCTKTSSATIVAPAALTASAAVTSNFNSSQLSCATAADGQITVTSTGGTGTLTYSKDGETFQNSNVFTGLAAGAYTLTTKDANGCTKTSTATITAPTAIAFSSAAVTSNYAGRMIRCYGDANGEITAVAAGGTGTLNYSISSSATTNTTGVFTGLVAGTYTITATDKNDCSKTTSVITITQPNALTITSASTTQNITCYNGSNGEVTVVTTGGTGTVTYALSAGGTNTTGVFSGLVAGTYTVTATDVNNCTTTSNVLTVTQPTELLISSASVTSNYHGSQISCNGLNDGVITVVASGGVEPRVYSITGSATTNTTGVFSGLAAGTYKVTVTDDHACNKTTSVITIAQPTAVSMTSATVTSNYNGRMISCFGQADAQITAVAAGGTGTRTFSITGSVTTNTTGVFSNLAAGTYTVTATDENGCFATSSVVTITQPTAVTMNSASVTSNYSGRMISCNGVADGTITAAASGGTGTITYSRTGSVTTNTTGVFDNLVAGTYKITATDVNGCFATSTVISITEPDALTIASASVTSNYSGRMISCNGLNDGQITVTTAGGTGTKTFTISGSLTSNTTGIFGSLAAGTYTVSVKDANNCSTATSVISITQPDVLVASASVTSNYYGSQISSNVATDGEITVTKTGGTSGYTYKLMGSAYTTYGTNNVFTGLGAGTYTAWVKDANGCADDVEVIINAPSPVSSSAAVTSDYNGAHIRCNTSADGEITVTASGGTAPLTYKQTSPAVGNYTTNNVFTGLAAGVYQFTSKDANGNTSVSSATIVAPAQLQITSAPKKQYNGRDLTCNGATNGEITINKSGGTGTVRYSINDGTSYETSNVFAGLGAGTYPIRIRDVNGCEASTSVTISAPAVLSVASVSKSNYTGYNVSCNGYTNGSITVTSNGGGTAPYEYSITGANGTIGYQESNAFTGLAAGTYNVYVKDVNGCTSVAFATELTTPSAVTAAPSVTSNYEGSQLTCLGATNGAVAANAGGGTGVYTYVWEQKDGANWNSIGTSATKSGLGAGTYRVTVTDENLCSVTKSVEIVAPTATVVSGLTSAKNYSGYEISCYGASDGEITVVGSGGTGSVYTYSINSTVSFQESSKFTSLVAGTYQMRIKDVNGCMSEAYQVILTQPDPIVLSISNTGPINTNNSVSFIVQTSGGAKGSSAPRYTYSWTTNSANGSVPLFVGESVASGLVTSTFTFVSNATDFYNGTYTVTVSDLNNTCPKSIGSQLIVYPSSIYVTTSGNDATGDGRPVNPLRTIQKANDVAIALNTLEVINGPFDESPVISKALTINGSALPSLASGRYFIYGTSSAIVFNGWPTSTWDNVGVNGNGVLQTAYDKVNGGASNNLWIIGEHSIGGMTISKQIAFRGATSAAAVPSYTGCDIPPTSIITHSPSSVADKTLFTMTGTTTKIFSNLELRIPNSSFFMEIANGSAGDVSSTDSMVYKWENVSTTPKTYRRLYGVTNANISGGSEKYDVAKFINDAQESTSGFGSGRVHYGNNGPLPVDNVVVGWKAEDSEGSKDVNDFDVSALSPMTTAEPRLKTTQISAAKRPRLKTTSSTFNNQYFLSFNGNLTYLDGNTSKSINGGTAKSLFLVFAPTTVGGTATTDQVIYKHGDHQKGMSVVQTTDGRISLNLYQDTDNTPDVDSHESWIFPKPDDGTVLIAQIYFDGGSNGHRAGASLESVSTRFEDVNHGSNKTGYVGDADFVPTELTTPASIGTANSVSMGCRSGSYYYGSYNNSTSVSDNYLNTSSGRGLYYLGQIAEIVMLNTANKTERDAAYCYLKSKYMSTNSSTGNSLQKDADVVTGEYVEFDPFVSAFPNPVETDVNIEVAVPYKGMALVTIKDALGRTVKTLFDGPVSDKTSLSLQADVRDLTTGAYFINVVGNRDVNVTTPILIRR